MHVKKGKKTFANLSADIVANATLLDLPDLKKTKISENHYSRKEIQTNY